MRTHRHKSFVIQKSYAIYVLFYFNIYVMYVCVSFFLSLSVCAQTPHSWTWCTMCEFVFIFTSISIYLTNYTNVIRFQFNLIQFNSIAWCITESLKIGGFFLFDFHCRSLLQVVFKSFTMHQMYLKLTIQSFYRWMNFRR